MRVTNKMIADQVVGNLMKNINKFMILQNQMSTGRQINKPSDDPAGTIKDLSYRSRLTEVSQFTKNVGSGQNWLTSVDVALGDLTNQFSQAKEIAVSMANDTYDATARDALAAEVETLFQQVMQAGNMQRDGRYLFSGHRTRTQSFTANAKGVVYNGDQGAIRFEIESATFVGVNISGSDILTKPFKTLGSDSDINIGVTGSTLLSNLNNARGVDLASSFVVTDENLNNAVTITIPPVTTDITGLMNEINAQLTAGGIDNLVVELGDGGNNLKFTAVDKPDVTLTTPLANVNYGNGLSIESNSLVFHNDDHSIEVNVDLAGATTIGDVIDEINNSLTAAGIANVTASLNAGGTGIDIDDTNIIPLGLTISESNSVSTAAATLGIKGPIAPSLNGTDLNPRPDFTVTESGAGQTLAQDIGLLGTVRYNLIGEDIDPALTLDTAVTLMNNGLGNEMGEIMISQGDTSRVINLNSAGISTVGDIIDAINNSGLQIQASINDDMTGIQIESTAVGMSLIVQNNDSSEVASNMGIAGSPDLVGNLIFLIDALRDNDQKSISSVIGGIENGIDHILNHRASVGAKLLRFENTSARLADYNIELIKLLSETEDVDIIKLTTDLAVQENIYTAALNSAAKIIQPSLLDFIR